MNNNVYMHCVNHSVFHSKLDINRVSRILDSGALMCLRRRGIKESTGFAGLDYVSLSDFTKKDVVNDNKDHYNAYHAYIRHGISLAFDKKAIDYNYDVIIPHLLNVKKKNQEYYHYMSILGNEKERFSDLPDEVQIKDFVLLSHLSYITYPCEEFFASHLFIKQENKRKKLIEELKKLRSVITDHGYNLDIYDIDSQLLLDEEGIEKILTKKI